MDGAAYYLEKARRCRRLIQTINDAQAIKCLSALAEEFDAKAKAVAELDRNSDFVGKGGCEKLEKHEALVKPPSVGWFLDVL